MVMTVEVGGAAEASSAVDDGGGTAEVGRLQGVVFGVVGLDDGGVAVFAEVVGGEAAAGEFFVGVHRVVDDGVRSGVGEGIGEGVGAGERCFLDAAAVGEAEDGDGQAVEVAESFGESMQRRRRASRR